MGNVKDKEYRVVRRDGDRVLICCICQSFSMALARKKLFDQHFQSPCFIQVVKKQKEDK